MNIDSAITIIEEREVDRPSATIDAAQEDEPPTPETDDEGLPPESATEESPPGTGDEEPLPETTDKKMYAETTSDESPPSSSPSPAPLSARRGIDSSSLYTTTIEYQAGELLSAEAYDDTE